MSRAVSFDSTTGGEANGGVKRRKLMQPMNKIAKFLVPSFPIFETKESVFTVDEYGTSIDDLTFQDITASSFSKYELVNYLILLFVFVKKETDLMAYMYVRYKSILLIHFISLSNTA